MTGRYDRTTFAFTVALGAILGIVALVTSELLLTYLVGGLVAAAAVVVFAQTRGSGRSATRAPDETSARRRGSYAAPLSRG